MENKVFLFPLNNSILFKKVTLPFHIFEARYRQMVTDAVKFNTPIAVINFRPKGDYEEIVCVAGHPHILATYPDGRMDIYITGSYKCRLISKDSEDPYIVYSYEELREDFISGDTFDLELESFKNMLKRWSVTFLPDANQREIFASTLDDPEILINYTTLFLVDDLQDKKSMMMAGSKGDKIKILMRAIGPKEVSLGPYMPVLKF
jgi:Lon protease-like protein